VGKDHEMKEIRVGSQVLVEKGEGFLGRMEVFMIMGGDVVKCWGWGELREINRSEIVEVLWSPHDSQLGDENDEDRENSRIEKLDTVGWASPLKKWRVGEKAKVRTLAWGASVEVVVCICEFESANEMAICSEYGIRVPGRFWIVPVSLLVPVKEEDLR